MDDDYFPIGGDLIQQDMIALKKLLVIYVDSQHLLLLMGSLIR